MAPYASKVAILGAGRVGSTLAYALAVSGTVREIVLIDSNAERAEGEAMDISHAVPFHAPVSVRSGGMADVAGALVTVVAAGAAQRAGESRPDLIRRNTDVLARLVPDAVRANPDGLLLIATNPVDALTGAALRLSGLPPARVFGSGTVLDTARLRAELARHFGVDARNVHAYVLGEHGDTEIVAWSSATLANVPLNEYCRLTGMACTPMDMDSIASRVRSAAEQIIRRKGATNFAIASSLRRIIEAIVRDESSVLTVSTCVGGAYEIGEALGNVCMSLPAIVDRSGVRQVLPIPLAPAELAGLKASAEAIRVAGKMASAHE